MKKSLSYGILMLVFIFGIILINLIFQIPQGEGFNPSDDGVILAQSYRLMNGEVPHSDFISIRPVGSALFHLLSFWLPFPLETTARWVVLLQYLLSSLLWSLLLMKALPKGSGGMSVLFFLTSLVFVLNQNYYNLFPWTTIDAIFFFSVGFFVFYYWKEKSLSRNQAILRYFVVVFFTGYSALCRQTFALPFLMIGIVVLVEAIRGKRLILFTGAALAGLWPYFVYLFTLIHHDAFDLFYHQLTGRTELWQTGFVKFYRQFWSSPYLLSYILIFLMFLYYRLSDFRQDIRKVFKMRQIVAYLLFLLWVGLLVMFFVQTEHLFSISFILFWFYLVLILTVPLMDNGTCIHTSQHWWIILVAWISAISLGDNSPVFALGLLAGGVFVLISTHLINNTKKVRIGRTQTTLFLMALSVTILALGLNVQRNNNYRDLPAGDLNFDLASVYSEMGSVRTNSRTYSYMREVNRIYNKLGKPRGRFVVLPNGSLIYPILDSPNPLPLDWMQGPEFVGQEKDLMDRLNKLVPGDGLFLLFDKYEMKEIATVKKTKIFDQEQYPYYQFLIENSSVYPELKSEWFEIRFWK